jgi:glycosyltransferase involved in cell wall biosynthesis
MRIAFVAQPFDRMSPPVEDGSLAMWISQAAKICCRRGHKTFIFGNHGGLFETTRANDEGVEHIFTPTGLNSVLNKLNGAALKASTRIGRNRTAQPEFASNWLDRGYAKEIGRRSRELGVDIIQVMNYSQFVPVIRKLNPKCRISLHMQCEWLTQLDRAVIEERISHADLIVGCSEYITRKNAEHFPQFESRCVTVPNAAHVTADEDRSEADPNQVLFVGRVSPEKGVHDLVKAFHRVLEQFPEARLHIVGGIGSAPYEYIVGLSDEPHVTGLRVFYEQTGDGKRDPYAAYLEREAGEELGKRIFFEGRIPHSDLGKYYRRAAALVNPSLSESFGITLVEAMMHRVPVVAARVGGMTYTVDHGITGLLVDPADSSALAAAICDILGDRGKARRMGDAGRKKAIDKFSWEKTTDILLDHFRRIVG